MPPLKGRESGATLTAATSRLVVVRAITRSWGLEEHQALVDTRVEYEELPWGDILISRVAEGSLDLVVYNEQRGKDFVSSRRNGTVVNAGTLGHSMGGKNFCVLANRLGRWGRRGFRNWPKTLPRRP